LGSYEGFDVVGATVSVRNAGDGLSQALAVEPVRLDLHSTVHLVLECEVVKHVYEGPRDKDHVDQDELVLVNVLRAGRATLIDRDAVKSALDEQSDRIRKAKEAAEGQLSIDDAIDGADPVEVLEQAEADQQWRWARTSELDKLTKSQLLDLAADHDVAGADGMVKAELVDAIVDVEDGRRP
jgi:hypothetical protein